MSHTPHIVQAADVDFSAVSADARLLAFDLDNTLARSKMPMSDETARLFVSLTHVLPLAIVTGGRFELIESQVLDAAFQHAYLPHLSLLPATGTSYYNWDGHKFIKVYSVELTESQRRRTYEALERAARQLGLWYDKTDGAQIEDRGSQITFSALGQLAHVDLKEAWDPDGAKREHLAQLVRQMLPDLNVRIAGATSIDVAQKGLDKAFAVRKLAQLHGCRVSDIVFVGDRMDKAGNDYPAALAGARAIQVNGPADTNEVMRNFMNVFMHDMSIDVIDRVLWLHGQQVNLSDVEFSLLLALMHARGESVTREKLIQDVWGYTDFQDTRLLSTAITRLRSRIEENPIMPRRIITVRGGGYKLVYR
ncbi:HAD-IIB family hydrolase [Alloscardovia venturai]|uniref:phosphomannomutase n=1 Tax=Alloscardovia venturai TaxID=1769421 RepID=A0ABW2Y519_9BIFI